MKIAEISAFSRFSVGNIMRSLKAEIESNGHECRIFYGRGEQETANGFFCFSKPALVGKNALAARFFDNDGDCDCYATKVLIRQLEEYQPDLIHMHCLHGYYVNYSFLFGYIRSSGVKVVWTMHDTWAFTGHCCYFDSISCQRWKTGCYDCLAKADYPTSLLLDRSKRNYEKKKTCFTSLPDEQMVIVSPCKWMDGNVAHSYLRGYRHKVIYNGIPVSHFADYHQPREKILLAVASVWDRRKNLQRVIDISKQLMQWKVIVVGKVDPRLVKKHSDTIVFIPRTTDLSALIDLYNQASVLINPTIDDNLPTVNIEAQLCGCRVLTYDVGGCRETDSGKLTLISAETHIDDAFLDTVAQIPPEQAEQSFDKAEMASWYYQLFAELVTERESQ